MKKTFLIFAVAATVAVTACSNGSATTEQTDSIVDSTATPVDSSVAPVDSAVAK